MKAIILARVSTEEQKEAGNSLPAQQDRLRSYIERKPQLILDMEYIFDESAYKEHRKEFDNVVAYIVSQKEVVAFCCDKVDRLTRDFLVGLPTLEKLRRDGKIELHFPSDNLILHKDSPATDLFHFNIAVSLAQYYSNSISDNVKRAYEKMRREGVYPSKPPLGYIRTTDIDGKKNIIPDPERASIIVRLFELYSTGNYSLETLLREAIRMGLKSSGGLTPPRSCIENILNDTFYYGVAQSAKYPPYSHKYQCLINKELFDKCQEIKNKKCNNRPKFVSKDFIFKALLTCKDCGCSMTPEMHQKKSGLVFVYYSCTNGKGNCQRTYVSESSLLETVYEVFDRLEKITAKDQAYIVQELRKTTEAETIFHKAQLARINAEYERTKQRDDNLLEAFLDKNITKEVYDKKHQQYYNSIQLLNRELEEHSRGDHDYQTTVATVCSLARRSRDIFESSEPSEKRAFLNYLLQNPTVQAKNLEFTIRSPFNELLNWAECPDRGAYRESNSN
ncbi:MAG: recombinase family protein [bacterium]